jgi:hypothetical protein
MLRRRNGRQQACEPCRKRKVACDHTLPVCHRCRKRNTPGACVYIDPSRQTLPKDPRPLAPSRSTGEKPYSASSSLIEPPSPDARRTKSTNSTTSPGYLGYTSFSAVYQEAQDSLSLAQGAQQSGRGVPLDRTETEGFINVNALSVRTLDIGLAVLRHVPQQAEAEALFTRNLNPNDGWIRLVGWKLLGSLFAAFGSSFLGPQRNPSRLRNMAEMICINTAKPLPDDELDTEKWLETFSGSNLRWESLGILFTYWALGSLSDTHRPELTNGGPEHSTRSDLTADYKECAALCAELSQGTSHGNSLLLYLIANNSILESITAGDASKSLKAVC